METLEKILAEHAFFKDLEEKHTHLIVGCASNVRFDAGRPIFREGEEAHQFYLLRQGKVALELYAPDRGFITIETLGEGDILGWSWLIPPYTWHFDAKALELTRAIALDGKCLRRKCEEDHDLGYELLKRFSHIMEQRLTSTRLQLLDIYGART
ncbi:MAG: cyclic nucleotide-binding domain-containing protein [Ignavibacteriales bacterium]|nr:cyclic nucleotide-binding domain-containing protein [Ignavibacteriales bacterium]